MPATERGKALRQRIAEAAPEIDSDAIEAVETGWQAWVAIGPNHVFKQGKSEAEIEAAIRTDRGGLSDAATWARAIHSGFRQGIARVAAAKAPPELIGHPRIVGEAEYLQARLTLLRDIVATLVADGQKTSAIETVERAVTLIPRLWGHGLHDLSGKFSCNVAFGPDRNPALIDYGELATSRRDVEDYIASKRWATNFSVNRDFPLAVRERYFAACEAQLTREALDQNWHDL